MQSARRRLAIIGGGPSGLVALKFAAEQLREWEVVCYEKQSDFYGAWGRTHQGFVSTSTKYTTQFACFQRFPLALRESPNEAEEFFRGDEYGEYLQEFAEEFQLRQFARFRHEVHAVMPDGPNGDRWSISVTNLATGERFQKSYSHVIICSGLANRLRCSDSGVPMLSDFNKTDTIRETTVVVIGGGESAVDIATRLSESNRKNRVFLSLRSGVRVSPRYHPIKNIPSDFLRTRLMMSIHEDIRNAVGQAFVTFRIQFARLLQVVFPPNHATDDSPKSVRVRKANWNLRINARARGKLFNMFHNKSDDFLTAVAEQRMAVIGPPTDKSHSSFFDFDQSETLQVDPDLLVHATGFDSRLEELTNGTVRLRDLYLGCVHTTLSNLYGVGYARPIIGNIPTIAEMQARYVIGLLAGQFTRPRDLEEKQKHEAAAIRQRYPSIDTENVYPVDMFPYCDRLAKVMNCYPQRHDFPSWRSLLSFWLSPASTNQYFIDEEQAPKRSYAPILISILLLGVKLVDVPYRLMRGSK